jgi:hypothetical protein
MPYDYSGGGGEGDSAASKLETMPESGTEAGNDPGEEQEPKPDEGGGMFIPAFPGSEKLQPGDPVPLRMVGQTADGQIEVEPIPMGDGEPAWKKDLKNSVQTVPGGAGIGNGPEM